MADKRELLFILRGKDQGAKKTFDDLADSADDARDDVDDMRTGLSKLDGQLEASRKQVEGLRKEIGKSGDLALVKDLEKAQREVNKLTKQRKLLSPGDGEEAAEEFSAGFAGRIGPLMAKAPISPPILAAVAGAAPAISSVLSGAVTLGVSAGVVAAGIKVAAQDPQVKGAAKVLGAQIGEDLGSDFGDAFVPETLKAMSFLRGEFRSLRPELRGLAKDASRLVEPLTRGVAGFARELVPGIRAAVRESEPLAELMEEHLPAAGAALSSVLRDLASTAEGSAQTLDSALTFIEGSLIVTGKVIQVLSLAQTWLGGVGQIFGDLVGGEQAGQTQDWANSFGDLADRIEETGTAASGTRAPVRGLAEDLAFMDEVMRNVHDANISAAEANLRYKDSLIAAKEAADGHKTVTGEEEQALLDLARASNDASAAMERSGASTGDLAAKTATARTNFINAATAMGFSQTKAEELADAYLDVPTAVSTKANLNKQQAEADLASLNRNINTTTRARTVVVKFKQVGGLGAIGQIGMSEGGYIDGPGPKGRDSQLRALAPGEFVLQDDIVDKVGVPALNALNRGDMNAWARQVGNAQSAPTQRQFAAVGRGGATRGGAPFGWAGMERSFVQFMVTAIDGAGGDSSVLRIGRGRAA